MSPFLCSFCSHANPAGSKFCNECGSPLSFKPCPECEAVNPRDAQTCHQCGGDLTPRPVPAPDSFEERLDTLRRYVDSMEGTAAAQRLGLLSIAARADSNATPEGNAARPDLSVEPPRMADEPVVIGAASLDTPAALEPPLLPAAEAPRPTLAMSAADSVPAPWEISSTSVLPAGGTIAGPAPGEPWVTTLPEPALASSANTSPRPSRRPSPGFFYAVGLGLIVLGVFGYAYSLYGLPPEVEQWIGSVRALAQVSIASIMTEPAPRTTPQSDNSTATAAAQPMKAVVENPAPDSMPGAGPAPSTPTLESPSSATPATTVTESNVATAQAAPPRSSEAPPAQAPTAAVAPPTEAKPAPAASEASSAKASQTRAKKRGSRTASKRTDPRKPPSNRSMLDPEDLTPAGADTRATAFPGVYSCTSGVAALGLCNSNERQEAN